jgi:hypothetical protein
MVKRKLLIHLRSLEYPLEQKLCVPISMNSVESKFCHALWYVDLLSARAEPLHDVFFLWLFLSIERLFTFLSQLKRQNDSSFFSHDMNNVNSVYGVQAMKSDEERLNRSLFIGGDEKS